MKPRCTSAKRHLQCGRHRAFTRKELVVVMAVLVVLGLLINRAIRVETRRKSHQGHCIGNLKNIGTSFRVFAYYHGEQFPFAATNPGVVNPAYQNEMDAWVHFQAVSNELGVASILTCPSDPERLPNTVRMFSELAVRKNAAISFFIGVTADEASPTGLLIGDRGVFTNGLPVAGKIVSLTTNDSLRWQTPFHGSGGNIGFADGSVQQIGLRDAATSYALRDSIPTNRLLLPLLP